jgi:hypothetical protein
MYFVSGVSCLENWSVETTCGDDDDLLLPIASPPNCLPTFWMFISFALSTPKVHGGGRRPEF